MSNKVFQDLSTFKVPERIREQRPFLKWALWIFFGDPLVSSFLPGTFWRVAILRFFGSVINQGVILKPRIRIKFPWLLQIGKSSWIGERVWIDNIAPVFIGESVCISQSAYLCTGNHDFKNSSFPYRLAAIHIGSESWVCARSVIGPGVTIGRGSIVSLGAVATRSIPPGMILCAASPHLVSRSSENITARR